MADHAFQWTPGFIGKAEFAQGVSRFLAIHLHNEGAEAQDAFGAELALDKTSSGVICFGRVQLG